MQNSGEISQQQTVGNGLKIMSANFVVQATSILLAPVVARLYSPEEIGTLSILLAIVGIFTTIASGRYEQAIMVEHSAPRIMAIFMLCLALCAGTSMLMEASLLLMGTERAASLINTPLVAQYLHFAPPLVFISSVGYILTFVFYRTDNFGLSARYIATQGIGNNIGKIALGSAVGTSASLIWANVASHIAGLISVARHLPYPWTDLRRSIRLMPAVAQRHKKFPLFNLPHSLTNAVASNLPIMLLALTYTTEQVGLFAICATFAHKPINIIAAALNQTLFHTSSRNRKAGIRYGTMLARFTAITAAIAIPVAVGIYVATPRFTNILFGEEWTDAGSILCALLPLLVLTLISTPLSFVPLMLHKQGLAMALEIASSVARIGALIWAAQSATIVQAVSCFALVHSAFMLMQTAWYFYLVRYDAKSCAPTHRD